MTNSKYNFNNVLVANTRLLAPMTNNVTSQATQQPHVVILNGKLNKCPRVVESDFPTTSSVSCSSCCLHVESSEFRRRSSLNFLQSNNQSPECFATCGDKRNLDIELEAKAQLSGKIVILAMSQEEEEEEEEDEEGHFANNTLKCQLANSWPFYKFNPKLFNDQQNINRKQTYYAKLNSKQLPNINIQSLTIKRDKKSKSEQVSLALDVPKLIKRNQQHLTKETLLINEFNCNRVKNNEQKMSSNQVMKIQILALINRELPIQNTNSTSNIVRKELKESSDKQSYINNNNLKQNIESSPKQMTNSSGSSSRMEKYDSKKNTLTNKHSNNSVDMITTQAMNSFDESTVNYRHSKLATTVLLRSTPTPTNAPTTLTFQSNGNTPSWPINDTSTNNSSNEHVVDSFLNTQINQRMDTQSAAAAASPSTIVVDSIVGRATNKFLATIPITLNAYKNVSIDQQSNNQMKAVTNNLDDTTDNNIDNNTSSFGLSTATRIGPIYLTELDSIRMRLKSNSLLMFTVVSSLIILTYTLCLIVYLRSRSGKNQQKNSLSSSSGLSSNRILRKNKQQFSLNNNNTNTNNNITLTNLDDQQQQQQQQLANNKTIASIEISEPFNLQMSSATKTRLDMMLGNSRRKTNRKQRLLTTTTTNNSSKRKLYTSNNNTQHSLIDCCNIHNVIDDINDYVVDSIENDGHYSHCLPQNSCLILPPNIINIDNNINNNHNHNNNNELYEDVPEFNYQTNFNQTHFLNQQLQKQYYTYTPIDFVKAIKEAATMAKTRFKTSSFKPHLNVIPESDLEYLQQATPNEELELFASILSQHLSLQNNQSLPHCITPEEFDSLVEEAMSHECSHKTYQKVTLAQKQNINTLFSRPQINNDNNDSNSFDSNNLGKSIRFSLPPEERQVSRSQILQHLKINNNDATIDLNKKTSSLSEGEKSV